MKELYGTAKNEFYWYMRNTIKYWVEIKQCKAYKIRKYLITKKKKKFVWKDFIKGQFTVSTKPSII